MAIDYSNPIVRNAVRYDEIGIEKECLRVTGSGTLAHTPHPFRESEKNIDRDFCENQIEFISDVFTDSSELISQLEELHDKAYSVIEQNGELLWSFSNPPFVSDEDDILIASFSEGNKSREIYRRYLANKYGKMKMLFSGIHYNFSFSEELITASQNDKNALYLSLAVKLVKYGWLLVYLMSASPVLDDSYIRLTALNKTDKYRYASLRCSEAGYWNDFIPILNYSSIAEYVESIQSYIDRGLLRSSSELYYPVRLKPSGKNSLEGLTNGINHVELRTLDLNPFSRVGISKDDIDFIHLLILYLSSLDDDEFSVNEQVISIKNIRIAALYDDCSNKIVQKGRRVPTRNAAEHVLKSIKSFADKYFPEFSDSATLQLKKLNGKRYARKVRNQFSDDFIIKGLELAKNNARGANVYV